MHDPFRRLSDGQRPFLNLLTGQDDYGRSSYARFMDWWGEQSLWVRFGLCVVGAVVIVWVLTAIF